MKSALFWIVTVVCLLVVAITGAVQTLFSPLVFNGLGFHPIAVEYFSGGIGRFELTVFTWGEMKFSTREVGHLIDVKALLELVRNVLVGAALLTIVLLVFGSRVFGLAAQLTPVIFVALGAAVVAAYLTFGFESVGVFFHSWVFPDGNWRFPNSSLMIQLYGTDVMVTGAMFVMGAAFAALFVLAIVVRFWRRQFS